MTIDIHGAQIYYEQHGEGAPLLLLHGWGCDADIWLPVTRDFQSARRITVLEFPGHGRSSEPPEPWSVTEYMQMTAEFIKKLNLQGTDIIAHSHGGRVALLLSATYPELLNKQVLVGCAGLIPKSDGQLNKRTRRYKCLRALMDNGLTRALLGEANVMKLRQSLRNRFGSADYKALKTDRMRATFNRVIAQDLEPYLEQIKAPTLLIFGDQDTATPLWMGQLMEQKIENAGLVTMQGAGHYAYLEQYPQFRLIVCNFLKIPI